MKIFLAIQSCNADRQNGRQDASKRTYLNYWDYLLEYRYFIGRGLTNPRLDEVLADVPDDYAHCPLKTRFAAAYAHAAGADYMFHCCTDTYVSIPRLLAAVPRGHQYVGNVCDEGHASGGCGYWLGREAMSHVANGYDGGGYEDLWVGTVLAKQGITPLHDPRYHDGKPDWDHKIITAHLSTATGNFDPKVMQQCHDEYMEWCL